MISDAPLSRFVESTGTVLVHSVWQFALVALVVFLSLNLLPGRWVTLRYAVCMAGMGLIAAAPVATYWSLPVRSLAQDTGIVNADEGKQSAVAAVDVQPVDAARPMEFAGPGPQLVAAESEAESRRPAPARQSWGDRIVAAIAPWSATLVSCWCCGVLVFALRPLYGWHTLRRLRRVGTTAVGSEALAMLAVAAKRLHLRSAPEVLKSTLVHVPLVVGYVRPVILLPAAMLSGLSPRDLEAILLHELAHIRRHDFVVNLLQTCLETLFFYHFAVWWVSHTLRCEREHCCDEIAAQALGNRAGYGRALLKLEELRGPIPSLALGATQGSLLRRIERLASVRPPSTPHPGAAALLLLCLMIASALGWGLTSARYALAQNEEHRTEQGELTPQQRAIELHRSAATIDTLPRFLIHAKAASLSTLLIDVPSDDPLENLIRSLDEPTTEADWYRYEKTFAWDAQRFIDAFYTAGPSLRTLSEGKVAAGTYPRSTTRWGTRDLGGERHQQGDQAARHVLRADAAAMWKDNIVTNPNYLLATTHQFWFGDNSYRDQNFSAIPPERAVYRARASEEFDGEMCDVIESQRRRERLWFSRKSGHLRGYLRLRVPYLTPDFYKSDVIERIAGREFTTRREYNEWYRTHYDDLPQETQEELSLAWLEHQDIESAKPSLLVRFRDYREVVPGVWWPFHEDRTQRFNSNSGFKCMLSNYRVQEIRTDVDLAERVSKLKPKEGEKVQDQRFTWPVNYDYSADLTTDQILKLVDIEVQRRQHDEAAIARLKEPYQDLIGQPAPVLPADGWVGGEPPELTGKPYLIHFWAVWCAPCKNDYVLLNRLAESGVTLVGLHPAGSEVADIENMIEEAKFSHATYVAAKDRPTDSDQRIAGYPAMMFPYYVLVDAQGKIAAHGSLRENNGEIIARFNALREQSSSK